MKKVIEFDLSRPYPELAVEAIQHCITERWEKIVEGEGVNDVPLCSCCLLATTVADDNPDTVEQMMDLGLEESCGGCPLSEDNLICGSSKTVGYRDQLYGQFGDATDDPVEQRAIAVKIVDVLKKELKLWTSEESAS